MAYIKKIKKISNKIIYNLSKLPIKYKGDIDYIYNKLDKIIAYLYF